MTDRQEDQLSMKRTLLAIRVIYAAQIAAVADVDADFEDLEAEVNAIKLLLPKQKLQTTGVARDKADITEDLVDAATIIAGAVMAFASKNSNYTLFEEVNYTRSTLEHTRDEVLADTCRIIHGRANDNLLALAGRGITALVLSDFMDLITELEGMSEAPRTATTQKSTATIEMAEHFTEGMKIIKERLDGGMKIFKTTLPELYTTYKNGRKVVNTAGKKKADADTGEFGFHVTDSANNPLGGVVVSFDNRVGSTDDQGNGTLKGVAVGNKLIRFFKPGYAEQFAPAAIQKGQKTSLTVQLEGGNTGAIEGTVLQGPGHVDATVEVVGTALSTNTNNVNYYYIGNITAGSQTVRATITGSNPPIFQEQTVMVTAGGALSVHFVFP